MKYEQETSFFEKGFRRDIQQRSQLCSRKNVAPSVSVQQQTGQIS